MKLTIGYVGLSHLGINYAIASAIKGFNVVCYDDDKNIIGQIVENILHKNIIQLLSIKIYLMTEYLLYMHY